MLHVFWNERKRRDVRCEHRRQKTPDRETERERGMYARFYGIGGTPELRARRRFVLSPFASSLPFSIALLPSRISPSLSLLLPQYMYCVQTCRYARVYLRGLCGALAGWFQEINRVQTRMATSRLIRKLTEKFTWRTTIPGSFRHTVFSLNRQPERIGGGEWEERLNIARKVRNVTRSIESRFESRELRFV